MNGAQAAFMMRECDRLERENRDEKGFYLPPTREQERDLLTRAEVFDWPWVRLWHRIRPPKYRDKEAA